MRILIGLGLLLTISPLWAQQVPQPTPFFVKVALGPAFPAAELTGNPDAQRVAAYAKPGIFFGLTVGREFTRWLGVSVTGFGWTNPVNNDKLTELVQDSYLDAFNSALSSIPGSSALPALPAITWAASAESWRFLGGYVSPFLVAHLGERFAVEGRLNLGLVNAAYPPVTATGTGTNFQGVLVTERLRGTSFLYGGGLGLRFRVQGGFHLVANVDAVRARPPFPASTYNTTGSWKVTVGGTERTI
ncbi:MAG: hypothetical protein H7Y12_00390, partial [Sphingobacteriaceae bacterium]|nr:hypothetical protein [Cytophagaceae bacterium]